MAGWSDAIAVSAYAPSLTRGPAVESRQVGPQSNVSTPDTEDDNYRDPQSDARSYSPSGGDPGPSNLMMLPQSVMAPSPAPYVVVPETQNQHDTLATAQRVPDLSYFGVVGTIGRGDSIDLYRLTLNSAAGHLDFSLDLIQASTPTSMQFEIFDGSGRALGVWSNGSQDNASLHAELSNLPAGTTLYLGVSAAGTSGSLAAAEPLDYQLWVEHQPAIDRATVETSSDNAVVSTAMMPMSNPAVASSTGPLAVAPGGDPQAAESASVSQGQGPLVGVGSAEVRSARPSGGLLSDGEPTPPAAREFSAAVNKEWDERSSNGPTPRDGNDVELTALSGRENDPEALVVIHGPGGFPLLGAVAIGHRRRAPAVEVGDFATPRTIDAADGLLAAQSGTNQFLAHLEVPVSETGEIAPILALNIRDTAEFRISVYSGLGLATVFTLNAVFSQPIAGFDYLPAHLDTDGRSRPDEKVGRRKQGTAS